MDIRQALERLSAAGGPSGFEGPAAKIAAELLRPLTDEVRLDRLGSVIGVKRCGRPGAKRLLLDAHLDEVGLIVTGHEEGFLRFQAIGGVDERILPDAQVTVLTDPPRFGVVACLPPHVQTAEDKNSAIPLKKLFIDVGLSQEQAAAQIPVGTPVVYHGGFVPLGEGQVSCKSMDDRACFVTLLRTLELLQGEDLDVDVYVLGSTREETGGAGALTAAFHLEPDWCVAVDVTFGLTPGCPKDQCCRVGGGPAIGVGPGMTRWMTQRMEEKAKAGNIPCQLELMEGNTGTNGWGMQTVREGIATAVVSLPEKYMHTPVEAVQLSDVENTAKLLAAFAKDLDREAGGANRCRCEGAAVPRAATGEAQGGLLHTVKTLCSLSGVSGWEDEVRGWLIGQAAPWAGGLRVDAMGNLIVWKEGRKHTGNKLMLCAHMDEVGLMVKRVTEDGYLGFGAVGGIDRKVLLAKRVEVGPNKVPGVIGVKPFHLLADGEGKKVPKVEELTIDIGARDRADALSRVSLGDAAVFKSGCVEFGDGFLKAKALDDRVGCAVLLELIKMDLPMDCVFVFTVQEEVGTRGAMGAAFSVCPEIALVVEGTTAADSPAQEAGRKVCLPGRGPVIPFMDNGSVCDRELFARLTRLAEENSIPWQTKHYLAGGTDARSIQRSKAGVRTCGISAAVRYLHAPNSVASVRDMEQMLRLAELFIGSVAEES